MTHSFEWTEEVWTEYENAKIEIPLDLFYRVTNVAAYCRTNKDDEQRKELLEQCHHYIREAEAKIGMKE